MKPVSLVGSIKKFFIDLLPGPLVRYFARNYVGGYGIENAFVKIDELWSRGICSTVDLLGEFVKNPGEVERNVQTYMKVIDMIGDRKGHVTISIKLSAFGLLFDLDLAKKSIERLVSYADERGINVTLDMEDHPYTDITLELYKELLKKHPTFGTVLQSRLFRTEQDIDQIIQEGVKTRIRTCIGIYIEPAEIAYTKKPDMKEKLLEYAQKLADHGHYVEFATHDVEYIRKFWEIAKERGYDKKNFEFQQLLGVPMDKIQRELVEAGNTVRLYVPFAIDKGDATAYLRRRLLANPKMAYFVLKNMFKKN